MELSLENLNGRRDRPNRAYKRFRQGESNYHPLLLSLGLLDTGLLIVAVTMAIMCAQVGEDVHDSAVSELLKELEGLRSRHLDVSKVVKQTEQSIARAIKNHTALMQQINQQQNNNALRWEKMEALIHEKSFLQSNVSALEESCNKCLHKWMYFNSSCYYFSFGNDRDIKKSWKDSRDDCISHAADLVVIDSEKEQVFVTNNMQTMFIGERSLWVGLTDVHRNGTWLWVNNTTDVPRIHVQSGFGRSYCASLYFTGQPSGERYKYRRESCDEIRFYWACEMQSS